MNTKKSNKPKWYIGVLCGVVTPQIFMTGTELDAIKEAYRADNEKLEIKPALTNVLKTLCRPFNHHAHA